MGFPTTEGLQIVSYRIVKMSQRKYNCSCAAPDSGGSDLSGMAWGLISVSPRHHEDVGSTYLSWDKWSVRSLVLSIPRHDYCTGDEIAGKGRETLYPTLDERYRLFPTTKCIRHTLLMARTSARFCNPWSYFEGLHSVHN